MSEPITVVAPSGVTPAWLTKALRARGIDATVADLAIEKVGTGQLGETRRFRLTYAGATPPDAPTTLIGKFPSDNEVAAKSGKEMGFYRSEVMFYREAAHRAVIKTPAV